MANRTFTKRLLHRFRDVKDSGFSSIAQPSGTRLLNKDGSFNVYKSGLTFAQRFSLYHWLIYAPLSHFMGLIFSVYLFINLLFATLYFFLADKGLTGISTAVHPFWESFFFSCQTFTTVGYGRVNPVDGAAGVIASLEAFLGLLGFALATGLVYGRFSRPKAKLMYSAQALISPYQDGKALMIRVANPKSSQVINVSAKIIFSIVEQQQGEAVRRFYPLKLEIETVTLLSTSWTIVHPITDDSPLSALTAAEMQAGEAEVLLMVQGYDETYAQEVHSRSSYTHHEIIWNAKFVRILGKVVDGRVSVELDRIGEFEMVAD